MAPHVHCGSVYTSNLTTASRNRLRVLGCEGRKVLAKAGKCHNLKTSAGLGKK